MTPALVGGLFGLLALAFSWPVLAFAFRRSVGTGVMVLFIPLYVFYFAFGQFEHPRKSWVIAGWLTAVVLTGVWLGLATTVALPLPPP